MKKTREKMKEELEKQAKQVIDELLDWNETHEKPDLSQIEDKILKLREKMSQSMVESVLESQGEVQPVDLMCPKCGKKMRYKGRKEKVVESRVGEVELERGHYYCEGCQEGIFPLDEQLRIEEKHWSEGVCRLTVWLCGMTEYANAAEILERVGGIHTSRGSAWRRTQKWGEAYRQAEEKERKGARQVEMSEGIVLGEVQGGKRLGVGMDGSMIHVRKEGWKEVKVGSVFEVEAEEVLDEVTQEEIEVGRAVGNSYTAYLGGPEVFGEKVWVEAKRRGWQKAVDTQVIGDGAVWIWNLVAEHFYDSEQVVDWFHAKEHLSAAGQTLYGEGTPKFHAWLNEQETHLFQGHAQEIAVALRQQGQKQPELQAGLTTEAGYFENNKRRMDYLEFRIQGWVIGSGMVESGGKQFKHRMAGPGMQWSRSGAERMLPIRSAILSGRFDQVWNTVYNSPQN